MNTLRFVIAFCVICSSNVSLASENPFRRLLNYYLEECGKAIVDPGDYISTAKLRNDAIVDVTEDGSGHFISIVEKYQRFTRIRIFEFPKEYIVTCDVGHFSNDDNNWFEYFNEYRLLEEGKEFIGGHIDHETSLETFGDVEVYMVKGFFDDKNINTMVELYKNGMEVYLDAVSRLR